MGYAPAGMRFNSVSTRHMSDTFHVCYEVMSVNTAEPRCAMHDSDQRNTGKSVDRGLVTERSVAGAAERSSIKKNKGKIAISSQSDHHLVFLGYEPCLLQLITHNTNTTSLLHLQ